MLIAARFSRRLSLGSPLMWWMTCPVGIGPLAASQITRCSYACPPPRSVRRTWPRPVRWAWPWHCLLQYRPFPRPMFEGVVLKSPPHCSQVRATLFRWARPKHRAPQYTAARRAASRGLMRNTRPQCRHVRSRTGSAWHARLQYTPHPSATYAGGRVNGSPHRRQTSPARGGNAHRSLQYRRPRACDGGKANTRPQVRQVTSTRGPALHAQLQYLRVEAQEGGTAKTRPQRAQVRSTRIGKHSFSGPRPRLFEQRGGIHPSRLYPVRRRHRRAARRERGRRSRSRDARGGGRLTRGTQRRCDLPFQAVDLEQRRADRRAGGG